MVCVLTITTHDNTCSRHNYCSTNTVSFICPSVSSNVTYSSQKSYQRPDRMITFGKLTFVGKIKKFSCHTSQPSSQLSLFIQFLCFNRVGRTQIMILKSVSLGGVTCCSTGSLCVIVTLCWARTLPSVYTSTPCPPIPPRY